MTHTLTHTLLRRSLGAALLLSTPILALLAGAAGFLALASVSATVPLLAAAGLAAAAGVGYLLARAAFALLGRGRFAALVFAAGSTVAVAALAAATVLHPMPHPAPGPVPADVRYWELPTGSRIAYVALHPAGAARPTPVIFLHGGPGTPAEGVPAGGAQLAAAGFDVYSYDQLGAGRSTRLKDVNGYTVARDVADLDAIRRVIGAQRVILVGESWGGSLLAQYLVAHGDHVAKAVFVSPGALWGRQYPGTAAGDPWSRLSAPEHARYQDLVDQPRLLAAALLMDVNPNAAHALVGDDEADHWLHELALAGKDSTTCTGAPPVPVHDNPQGFYTNQVTSRDFDRLPDPRPALRAVRVPSLILRGSCDFMRPQVTAEYRSTLPDSQLVLVDGAGHDIAAGQPARYTALLTAFLLGRPLPRTAP
ncbi:alpha/beta fold hydrolase [Streptacidiphilus sp. P02-A3a]|uniref:alpha/beta fold hydrolase n=1 Tax=Streptacidiphilus sp. P02-A3a TaxID=2704468 RepID=UPI0015FA77D3|nr:alpha/beta fold hydrolase [Streptacidiphilus sp. P02-A3a]QMU70061.1 alpha/beta fold hydrolase [Streptacidiphilus sp. P02-A3a]